MRANCTHTAGMWISDLQGEPLLLCSSTRHTHHTHTTHTRVSPLPEVPEEEVSYLAVALGSLQQEACERTVVVGLVPQHLHQLEQVLRQLLVTGKGGGGVRGGGGAIVVERERKKETERFTMKVK